MSTVAVSFRQSDDSPSTDAKQKTTLQSRLPVDERVYADDTLVVAAHAADTQSLMHSIRKAGENRGLSFNWTNWSSCQSDAALALLLTRRRSGMSSTSWGEAISNIWLQTVLYSHSPLCAHLLPLLVGDGSGPRRAV